MSRSVGVWRGDPIPSLYSSPPPLAGEGQGGGLSEYADIPGFCKAATLEEIASHDYVLTPGRYVGAEEQQEENGEAFGEKMRRLAMLPGEQQCEAARFDVNLKELGYGW
jgi:type I restriction enzyme M protein